MKAREIQVVRKFCNTPFKLSSSFILTILFQGVYFVVAFFSTSSQAYTSDNHDVVPKACCFRRIDNVNFATWRRYGSTSSSPVFITSRSRAPTAL